MLGVEGSDRADVLKGLALEHELSVYCPVCNVVLDERDLDTLCCDEVRVGNRCVTCLCRALDLTFFCDRCRKGSAYCVVGT